RHPSRLGQLHPGQGHLAGRRCCQTLRATQSKEPEELYHVDRRGRAQGATRPITRDRPEAAGADCRGPQHAVRKAREAQGGELIRPRGLRHPASVVERSPKFNNGCAAHRGWGLPLRHPVSRQWKRSLAASRRITPRQSLLFGSPTTLSPSAPPLAAHSCCRALEALAQGSLVTRPRLLIPQACLLFIRK